MVRHTHEADDESTTTTRRTRADLRYLAGGDFDDASRNTRLRSHGWVHAQGRKTGDGEVLAATVEVLARRNLFDKTVDIMGLADFVDAVTTAESPLSFLAGVRTVDALADAAVAVTDYDGFVDDYDPSPTYAFDARKGTVEVGFSDDDTAREFEASAPDRFDVERKHDERFKRNRNPRRFVATVA